ncbi:hypothetical protein E2320_019098, partial [Naja naja]
MTSERISSTDFPRDVQPETIEFQAFKIAQIIIQNAVAQFQQESIVLSKQKSEIAVLYPDPDEKAFSEKIDSMLEESPGECTREGIIQTRSPPEMELPTSSPVEETEQKVITSEGISSTEFPKDVQSETIESQSLKSAQKASTVVQFQQEPMALSKQKSETAVLYPDEVAFSEKIDSVLEESPEKCTRDTALQMSTSGLPPEIELPKSSSEEEIEEKVVMTSEEIPSAEFPEESAGRYTTEGAFQTGTCGSPPEIDLPISSVQEEAEQKVVTSEGVSTSTDFPKVVLPETTESQAYKIVQIIIQYAVAQFQHDSMALSKQKRETAIVYPDPDKVAFSEKIDSVLEESAERRSRENALQIGSSSLHTEIELPTSSADKETEENVMISAGIPSTEFPKEVQPETTESQAYKIAQKIIQNAVAQFQQETMALSKQKSEAAVLYPDPDAGMFSEKIDSALEESPGKCTREDALQTNAPGSPPEMELPISSADEETEKKVMMASERIPSTEFPKSVQSEAIESQAYKIVQIIIQNAVAQFQQESMAISKQKSAVMYPAPDAVAFSEQIESMLEEASGRCTRESVLQTSTSGSPSEMEVLTSSADKEIEEVVMTSERIPFTEFQKDVLPETIESRAYKLVQIIIQNAIAQFKQESMALSKQKSEAAVLYPDADKMAFPEKIDSVLEESAGKCTREGPLQTDASGSTPEMELPKFSSEEETEEKVMPSESIPFTEFPAETEGRCTTEGALQTGASGSPPEMELPKSLSEEETEEKSISECILSTEFSEESAGRCTREGAFQTCASGSPPEMELPKFSSEEETEGKVMTSECISSVEFPGDSERICTTEGALQMSISGSPPEMELPKSSSEVETEEKVVMTSEGIPCTKFSEESAEKCTREGALQMRTSGSPPEMELPKSSSEVETEEKVVMTSEGIPCTKFSEESAKKCTREGALQMSTSGSPPEMELPKSSSEVETEEKVMMTSEEIPSSEVAEELAERCTREHSQTSTSQSPPEMELLTSSSREEAEQKVMTSEQVLTSTEFPKYVPTETIESQSYKIVQKISAVAQFQQSQEAISPLKQKSELCLMDLNEFGIQEVLQVGHQVSLAEEKNHEIQPATVNVETEDAIEVAKEMPSYSIVSEDRENWNSRKTDADLETVKEIVNETESKKYDSKLQLKTDVVVSTETQNIMLGNIVSADHPVGSLETEQSTIKDLEVELIDENQEKLIEHQTQKKRKEDYSQSTEFPEMPKEEDTISVLLKTASYTWRDQYPKKVAEKDVFCLNWLKTNDLAVRTCPQTWIFLGEQGSSKSSKRRGRGNLMGNQLFKQTIICLWKAVIVKAAA